MRRSPLKRKPENVKEQNTFRCESCSPRVLTTLYLIDGCHVLRIIVYHHLHCHLWFYFINWIVPVPEFYTFINATNRLPSRSARFVTYEMIHLFSPVAFWSWTVDMVSPNRMTVPQKRLPNLGVSLHCVVERTMVICSFLKFVLFVW